MSVLGLIPARGGSVGIPGKNLASLNGRPLIDYTICAARDSAVIGRLVVSSDSERILGHSRTMGAETLLRPAHLAQDDSPTAPTIEHALLTMKTEEAYRPDWVVLLQPTSPLRSAGDIDKAFTLLEKKSSAAVISVFEPTHSPYKALVMDRQGTLHGLMGSKAPFMRRQDCPTVYYPNGAIYIFRAADFMANHEIPLEGSVPYVMSKRLSIDIDDADDLKTAEAILRETAAAGAQQPLFREHEGRPT